MLGTRNYKGSGSQLGVGKLWLLGEIRATAWFCMAPKPRTFITFLSSWGKKSKEYYVTCENYMKFTFKCL